MKKRTLDYLGIAVVLSVLVVAGLYVLQARLAENRAKKDMLPAAPHPLSSPVLPTITMPKTHIPPGWKLFESKNFYFSFAYPPEKYRFVAQETERADADENSWRLSYYDSTKEENLEALKNTSQIIIRALPYEYDLEHYAKIDYPAFFQDKQVKTITLGMIPAYEVVYTDTYSGIVSTNVISFYRGHIYQITFASHNENIYKADLPLFETLISTLRFTD